MEKIVLDEVASVWMPAKACQLFDNDFTLFQHYQFYSIMYTDKDSNLISDLRTKYGEDRVRWSGFSMDASKSLSMIL